jgi:hypothetical protein
VLLPVTRFRRDVRESQRSNMGFPALGNMVPVIAAFSCLPHLAVRCNIRLVVHLNGLADGRNLRIVTWFDVGLTIPLLCPLNFRTLEHSSLTLNINFSQWFHAMGQTTMRR